MIIISQVSDGELTGAKLNAVAFNFLLNSCIGGILTDISLAIFVYSAVLAGSIKMVLLLFGMSIRKELTLPIQIEYSC